MQRFHTIFPISTPTSPFTDDLLEYDNSHAPFYAPLPVYSALRTATHPRAPYILARMPSTSICLSLPPPFSYPYPPICLSPPHLPISTPPPFAYPYPPPICLSLPPPPFAFPYPPSICLSPPPPFAYSYPPPICPQPLYNPLHPMGA